MPLDLFKPTDVAVPLFIVLVIVELIVGYRKGKARYEAKDTFASMFMGLGSTVVGVFTAGFVFALSFWVWENYAIFDFGTELTIGLFLLAFVLDDLAYYWIHRMGHRMRWMWAAHVIHHSSQHYNLSTALRQTWTGALTPGILFRMPIFVLGIHPSFIFFAAGINLVYQFWIHTEAIDKCPKWFEAIFNTPSHHRVHHANNPRYLDANYAGVFIVWDKLFGSFIPERKDEKCNYGLVTDLGTFNPLRIAFHEWWGIVTDIAHAKSWRERLLFLIAPPGWTPDGSRMTSEMIRDAWLAREAAKKQAAE